MMPNYVKLVWGFALRCKKKYVFVRGNDVFVFSPPDHQRLFAYPTKYKLDTMGMRASWFKVKGTK